MVGIFFFFVMMVAVGSLLDCYVKGVNNKIQTPTIRFSNEDNMMKGELIESV